MKNLVIKLHLQKRKGLNAEPNLSKPKLNSQNLTNIEDFKSKPTHSKPASLASNAKKSVFNNLPNELTLKILSYLDLKDRFKAAQVCKRWNRIVYDKSNWKELNFSEWKTISKLVFFYFLK